MKKNSSSLTARTTFGALFLISGIGLFCTIPFVGTHAANERTRQPVSKPEAVGGPTSGANPSSGAINPTDTTPVTWVGTTISPGGNTGESTCVDSGPGQSCEIFTLTINGTQAQWAGKRVQVLLTWNQGAPTDSANEYDIYIHQGNSTSGPLVTSAINGPGLTNQTAFIDVSQWGTGVFTIHIAYDTTPTSATDEYHGAASVVSLTPAPPPPAPQDTGPKIGYENFTAPGVLVPVTTTSAGQQVNSVEYMGRNAGEPSVGSNWATDVANFQSDLQTLFVTFNDSCPNTGQSSIWVDRAAPTSVVIDSDPIGFTDRGFTDALGFHSRVFAAELTLLSPDTVKISYTDNDGLTWVPTQSGGLASAVDHETLGGGPYHAPIPTRPPGTVYPNAVYYCSQDIAAALCSRSDDGGLTYGPSVAIYNLTACGGLHGHVKVAPDGTVYVPNRACGSQSAVVVSQDNGITWTVRPVQNGSVTETAASDDPAVGIDGNGRVYFLFADNGTAAGVATSDDFGATWQNIFDVGAIYGLKQIAFPAAVGGSATPGNPNSGRAAVAFYGSTTATGDSNAANFTGVWHLYVAQTFDGGATWTTTDVTPNAPMQRSGLLRGGGADITRNLLDFFDITINRDGRVLVGYVNGCEGGNCAQAAPTATGNAYTTTATIARQSSGRRLLASKDPANSTSQPGMPSVTQRRIGLTVHLAWSEADTGNSPITSYRILRGTASGAETLLTTVAGTQTGGNLDDLSATDTTKTYYYKVLAVNGVGTSCGNNEVASPYLGNACTGLVIHQNDPSHPEANAGTNTPASLLIDYIAVGEPASSPGDFLFKMKVNDLSTVPPNSRWRIMWNSFSSPGQQYYVGMTTGNTGTPTFEYGTLADAGVPAVFVIEETTVGAADPGSNFNPDGTISIFVPKSAFGNPQPGDLLGAVGGRTITGDTSNCATDLPPCTPESKLERSNEFVDHTFVKAQSDNSYPAATYTVLGNSACEGGIVPTSAVSRKNHDGAGTFDVDLPLTGTVGIECRSGQGTNSNNHQVVVTFPVPITAVANAMVSSGTGSVSTFVVSGNQVIVNLTGVANAQTIMITLSGVNDGTNVADVSIPMGLLLGDVNASRRVDAADVSLVRQQTLQTVTTSNFREDINASGRIDAADVSIARQQTLTSLP
jgi:hypothetical protein